MAIVIYVKAIVIESIRDLIEHQYGLWVSCKACNRSTAIDLHRLVAQGLGDRPHNRLIFRCEMCKGMGNKSITWNGKVDR